MVTSGSFGPLLKLYLAPLELVGFAVARQWYALPFLGATRRNHLFCSRLQPGETWLRCTKTYLEELGSLQFEVDFLAKLESLDASNTHHCNHRSGRLSNVLGIHHLLHEVSLFTLR